MSFGQKARTFQQATSFSSNIPEFLSQKQVNQNSLQIKTYSLLDKY